MTSFNSHPALREITVWLVEDDSSYRDMLVYLLDHHSGIRCTRVFFSCEELQALVEGDHAWTDPDVVLMDIILPGCSGIEGTRFLKARLPEVPILMLTNNDQPELIFAALKAGASGYILKDMGLEEIIGAVEAAVRGGTLLAAPVAEQVLQFFMDLAPQADYGLTQREREVLALMPEGQEIAEAFSLSLHTLDNHLRSIYRELHVRSNLEAVTKGYREHLI